jgi:hypothetical protein
VTKKTTWFDDEPRAVDFVRQAADLFVRGVRRPWLTLLVALIAASAVGAALAFRQHTHAPRLVLRLVEGSGDPSTTPNLKRRLGDYVREGILTSEPLLAIIRRHGLYPNLARSNPRAAIDSFREDIKVEVYQNYFVEAREPGSAPRSARVAVSYRTPDRLKALAVTRDLGAIVVEHETRRRREQAMRAMSEADRARDLLQVALQHRTEEIALKEQEVASSERPEPARQIELVGLLASLPVLEHDLDAATRRAASFELGAALEQAGVGLRFETANEAVLRSEAEARRFAWIAAIASFAFGLPLSATAVGAFSARRRA